MLSLSRDSRGENLHSECNTELVVQLATLLGSAVKPSEKKVRSKIGTTERSCIQSFKDMFKERKPAVPFYQSLEVYKNVI